jgi:hypothetical protein|tara:strand:+ start:83 stop:667 length:585 start_codon:yes stop_codon:yes gene_type:complete
MSAITSLPSGVGGGSLSLISTTTASSSSTVSIASGIDSTYKEYIVKFFDVHPATDNNTSTNYFEVNFRDGSTDYDATKTTTIFRAYHFEDNSTQALAYDTSHDLAQSTSFQRIAQGMGNDNDQCVAGVLHLFDPSSTTFVKHFICETNNIHADDASYRWNVAGYINTTTAIDGIQFKMTTGNIDSGTFKLYGVS